MESLDFAKETVMTTVNAAKDSSASPEDKPTLERRVSPKTPSRRSPDVMVKVSLTWTTVLPPSRLLPSRRHKKIHGNKVVPVRVSIFQNSKIPFRGHLKKV